MAPVTRQLAWITSSVYFAVSRMSRIRNEYEKTRLTYNELSQNMPMIAIFGLIGICSFRRDGNGKSKMMPSIMILRIGTDSLNLK